MPLKTSRQTRKEEWWVLVSALLWTASIGLFLWYVATLLPSPYRQHVPVAAEAEESSAEPPEPEPVIGQPTRLRIPSISVDTAIEHVGLTAEGDMDVPKVWENVAWYQLGPKPGEKGSSVIAGHLDSYTGRAVFWDLGKLKIGDEIFVEDDTGTERRFRVMRLAIFDATDAPVESIFGDSDTRKLNLITCGGTWNTAVKKYSKRRVVYTEAVE